MPWEDLPYKFHTKRWYKGWHIVETEDAESFDLLQVVNADGQLIAEMHTHEFGFDNPEARQRMQALINLAECAE